MSDYNAKTVFLLDHTNHFKQPSGDEIVMDGSSKMCNNKRVFHKSIWSNVTDAVLQYCRIAYDVFSSEKLLWNIFSHEGSPAEFQLDLGKCVCMPGLEPACNMLQMLSPMQKTHKDSSTNVGRVIIISAHMRSHILSWIPHILRILNESPDSSGRSTTLIIILTNLSLWGYVFRFRYTKVTASEWLFIDLVSGDEPREHMGETVPELVDLPPDVNSSSHRFLYHRLPTESIDLYRGLMRLVETHYNLASTLVQDIPMKEEANTNSSSAMYGVELIHQAQAHDLLQRVGLADQLLIRTDEDAEKISFLQRPNSGFSKTLGIKWVTPKSVDVVTFGSSATGFMHYAIAAYRVTLADVGNRASTCLAQFVLGGRSVALAHRLPVSLPLMSQTHSELLPTYSNNEALLLTCHGSVMYLHVLAALCPLAHPPLVPLNTDRRSNQDLTSEVRLQSFIGQLTRSARLAPASARLNYTVVPRERAQQHLGRSTRYWPLFESETFLGNNKLANPLFEHLPKEYLEPNEVVACSDAIDKLFSSLKHNVSLSSDLRKVGAKRTAPNLPVAPSLQAEAVALAVELDHLLSVYANLSAEHESLLRHWRTILNSTSSSSSAIGGNGNTEHRTFATMDLAGMVLVGKKVASGQTVSAVLAVPEQLSQTMSSLKTLCKQLAEGDKASTVDASSATISRKRHLPKDADTLDRKSTVLFEPANLVTFLQLLQPAKHPHLNTNGGKLEFVGVATADSKGVCQLYRSLKDKEKEKTAT
ncbi:Cell cycle regulator Mat89Bb [Fasciola gigantica]|uniref:Cell cycle regulator Mat89Bb n=1 Tax=Fasciola gigantica TaxID=46835 RepID=A0A504YAD2_FASGI|nr:Cell cycle regulator Mat89Bb [Fasciola gigantica]